MSEPTTIREPTWIKANITYQEFMTLPPAVRLALEREHNPEPVKPRRPTYRHLTDEEVAALQAEPLSWSERLTKARALQQSPPPIEG